MQDIKKSRIAGPEHAVGINMGMGTAALAGDRVDAFDMLGTEIVEHFADDAYAFVLLRLPVS